MAWRSYTTCQGPCEPDVSSGRLLDQQLLQPWLRASLNTASSSASSDPFLASWDQHGGKCLSPTCPSRVCVGLSSLYTLSGRVELPPEKPLASQGVSLSPDDGFSGGRKEKILCFTHFWDLEWAWQQGLGALERHTRTTHLADYFAQALCRGDCTQEGGTQAVCSLCLQIQAGPVKVKGRNRSKAEGQDAKVA